MCNGFSKIDGFSKINGFVDQKDLVTLRSVLAKLACVQARRLGIPAAYEYFNGKEDLTPQDFVYLADACPQVLTLVINTFMQTAAFKSFVHNESYLKYIADNVFGGNCLDQLVVTEENFRVDLPAEFKAEKQRFSLSWHQESGYFENYVSHSRGVVIWIPLFNTLEESGSLRFFPGSHLLGPVSHNKYYADTKNKKNMRSEVDIEKYGLDIKDSLVLSVKAGDAIIFDFNLIHASGHNNAQDFARCTIQSRVSLFSDAGFRTP